LLRRLLRTVIEGGVTTDRRHDTSSSDGPGRVFRVLALALVETKEG
jgi:hypothetical protein